MRRVLAPLLLSGLLLGVARAEPPVYFTDSSLKAAVEYELWISDPTPTDMLQLTRLRVNECAISDLTGLEYAANLQTLDMSVNWIEDISALSGLTNLKYLSLNNNQISNLSALSHLHNLEELDIHDNPFEDISPLSGLTNLWYLKIECTYRVRDLSPLSGLTNLETLLASFNKIGDISVLSSLTHLEQLDLSNNVITEISPLSALTCLRILSLASNNVQDISPLVGLTRLERVNLRGNALGEDACKSHLSQIELNNPHALVLHDGCPDCHMVISSTAGGSATDPGEGEFLYDNGEVVNVKARADPCFVFAGWTGSCPSQSNPVFIVMRHDHEIRANFVSVLDTIHVDDDGPNDPGPSDPLTSDQGENGTTEHPFDRIQEAIEVAHSRATVFVHEGTYRERIDLLGKSLTLTGFDPNDRGTGAWPVLNGGGAGPVVSFTHGEDPNCTLAGFVITAGNGQSAGAILCSAGSPTIADCLIVGNRATDLAGAAIYCVNSHAVFFNCTIADNHGGDGGAGLSLVDSSVILANSILWGDAPQEIRLAGLSEASIRYSDVAGGWPGPGNVDADPLFAREGYWVDRNQPGVVVGRDYFDAIWVLGDCHLLSHAGRWDPQPGDWVQDDVTSPCIDAGDPSSSVDAEPAPNGGIINIGAYGGTAQASKTYPCP